MWTEQKILFNGSFVYSTPVLPKQINVVAVDVETDTSKKYGHIRQYGLSFLADVTIFTATWHDPISNKYETVTFNAPFSFEQYHFITECLNKEIVIAHNAVFDLRQLKNVVATMPHRVWCTMTMQRLIHPAIRGKYGLLSCADHYKLEYPAFLLEQKSKRGKQHKQDLDTVLQYAQWDSLLAYQVYEKQCSDIVTLDYPKLPELAGWEIEFVTQYCKMAREGIGINLKYAQKKIAELTELRDQVVPLLPQAVQRKAKLNRQTKELDLLNVPFNPGSPKQRELLLYGGQDTKTTQVINFNVLGIPKPKYEPYSVYFTEHFGLSTSGNAIKSWLTVDRAILEAAYNTSELTYVVQTLQALHQWVSCDTLIRVINGLVDHASVDGKVHTMLAITTETTRPSSTHPQMQNIKLAGSPDDIEGNLCGLFRPVNPDEFSYVEIDYNNAENRFQAVIGADNILAQSCMTQDFHAANAALYFPEFKKLEPGSPEWKHYRFLSKSITFGSAYGMGKKKLAAVLGVPIGKAEQILQNKYASFKGVYNTQQLARKKVQKQGYITLWTGRRLPVNKEKDYQSWNYIVQGGISQMLKRSLVLIQAEYDKREMLSYVLHDMHDAVILAVHRTEWDLACQIASNIMEKILPDVLNNRTNPPMQWIAKPDFFDNAKKWGKYQYIPREYVKRKDKTKVKEASQASQAEQVQTVQDTIPVESWKLPVWCETESGSYVPGEHQYFERENAKIVFNVWLRIAALQGIEDSKLEKILGYSLQELREL